MVLNIWVRYMNKNTNKLEKIVIILLFFIIIAIGSYFNLGTENEIGNTENNNKIFYEMKRSENGQQKNKPHNNAV